MSFSLWQAVRRMIPLADKFRRGGCDWRLLKRAGDVALLEQSKPNWSKPAYAVVIVQKHRAKTWPDGRVSEAREAMPPDEAWGTLGWTYSDLPPAEVKFEALVRSLRDALSAPEHSPKTGSERTEGIPAVVPEPFA